MSDVHKRFGSQQVLAGVDLSLRSGSLTVLLGPSGSGKTTLLRLLAGFEAPDRGTVRIGEQVLDAEGWHVHPEHRRIGYVPQEGGLFPHLNVAANVAFGLPRSQRKIRAGELLELVGLSHLARRYPHQLSGGQQQRVALARALAIGPRVVLLDEPFASLDATLRANVREQVRALLAESRTTTLLVTHDQDEALSVADRVAVLHDGRIAQHCSPQELYARPVHDALARFVGEANIVEGSLRGSVVETPLGCLDADVRGQPAVGDGRVSVLIRPEQIDLHPAHSGDGAGGQRLVGEIVKSSYHGHETLLQVDVDGIVLTVRARGDTVLSPGQRLALQVRGPVLVWPIGRAPAHSR